MNKAIDELKQKYQPIISQNAEVLEQYKKEHASLQARQKDVADKLAKVESASASYIIHQKDHCRNRITELSIQLQEKKEYHKKLKAKLQAYKEVLTLVQHTGSAEA